MRIKRTALTAAGSLLAGLAVALTSPATQASADSTTPLALTHYSHIAVDTVHGHLFFSQGAGTDSILVTDLDGSNPVTITGEPGATGLALSSDDSTLYVALADGDAISAINTSTLTESARYPSGTGSAPGSVAFVDSKLWYSYGPVGDAGIGELDPAAAGPTVTPQPGMGTWEMAPLLAGAADVLAAAQPGASSPVLARTFNVSGSTVTTIGDTAITLGGLTDLSVTPDGSQVMVSAAQDQCDVLYPTAGLSGLDAHNYCGGPYQTAGSVATAPDGTVALAYSDADDAVDPGDNLRVLAPGNPPAGLSKFEFDIAPDQPVPDGLAWAGSGPSLYVVSQAAGGGYALHILDNPRMATTTIALSLPSAYAVPGSPYTLTGRLASAFAIPAGEELEVNEDGKALPNAVLGADGEFSFTDVQPTAGTYDYEVTYPGDATHESSTSTTSLHVAAVPTGMTVSQSASSTDPKVLSGQLSNAPYAPGTVIQVRRTPWDGGTTVNLPPIAVNPADGTFTLDDTPQESDDYTYTLTFAGDLNHQPTSDQVSMVDRTGSDLAATMTLTAPATAVRGVPLAIHGTLANGPFPAGERVQVSRQDSATPDGSAPWTVPLNTNGTFTVADTPQTGGEDSYEVSYPGDGTHYGSLAFASVRIPLLTTSLTVTTNSRNYANDAWATITAHLGFTYNGRTVTLYARPYGGAEIRVTTGRVDSHGNLVGYFRTTTDTEFYASFTGDYRYAPASAAVYTWTSAGVTASVGPGYYTTVKKYGVSYRVFHSETVPLFYLQVTPAKPQQCTRVQVQQYLHSAWHTIANNTCVRLTASAYGSSAALGTIVISPGVTGQDFRLDAEYIPGRNDHANITGTSAWQYFTFTH